jgi:hypothetical protein
MRAPSVVMGLILGQDRLQMQRVPPGRVSDSANPQVRTVTAVEVVRGGIGTLALENVGPSAYRQHCERGVRMSDTLGAVPETGRAYRS